MWRLKEKIPLFAVWDGEGRTGERIVYMLMEGE